MMNFQPFGDRVLIEAEQATNISEGGIHLPGGSQERPNQGFVVSVGDDVEKAKEGDYVMWEQYAGELLKLNGKDYVVVKEQHVMGVFKE